MLWLFRASISNLGYIRKAFFKSHICSNIYLFRPAAPQKLNEMTRHKQAYLLYLVFVFSKSCTVSRERAARLSHIHLAKIMLIRIVAWLLLLFSQVRGLTKDEIDQFKAREHVEQNTQLQGTVSVKRSQNDKTRLILRANGIPDHATGDRIFE